MSPYPPRPWPAPRPRQPGGQQPAHRAPAPWRTPGTSQNYSPATTSATALSTGLLALPRQTRRRPLILLSTTATLLVILGTAIAVQQSRSPDDQTPSAPTTSAEATTTPSTTPQTTPASPPKSSPPAEPADPDTIALRRLKALRTADRAKARPDGRYVVQLASKYPGIHTPKESSPNGDHIFSATEILREHERIRKRFGAATLLLLSTDYGKRQKVDGHALWVTFVDPGLDSLAAGTEWCTEQFSGLSPEAVYDTCQARQLNPS